MEETEASDFELQLLRAVGPTVADAVRSTGADSAVQKEVRRLTLHFASEVAQAVEKQPIAQEVP